MLIAVIISINIIINNITIITIVSFSNSSIGSVCNISFVSIAIIIAT